MWEYKQLILELFFLYDVIINIVHDSICIIINVCT